MKNLFTFLCGCFVALSSVMAGETESLPPRLRAIALVHEEASTKTTQAVVLGGGMGGLTAALYLARADMAPILVEGKTPGGLLTLSHSVQNWPGELEIDGKVLMDKIIAQNLGNGVELLKEEVIRVDFSRRPFVVTTRSLNSKAEHKIFADSCIIAMGTTPNMLGIPGEEKYWGKGVTNCAICDGSLYREQVVGVVGGGDAAVLEALYLSNLAKEVHVFVRSEKLRANESKRIETLQERPNVKFYYNTEIVEVKGDKTGVTGVTLKTKGKALQDVALDGLFLAIGSRPNTELFQNILRLDERGYIQLKKDQETSVPGVYAIGDIVDPTYKQAITAAGEGAKAALQVQKLLMHIPHGAAVIRKGQDIKQTSQDETESESQVQNGGTLEVLDPKQSKETTVLEIPLQKEVALVAAVQDTSQSGIVEISSMDQFQQELKSAKSPVVVDFYATWCGPCQQIAPQIEAHAKRLAGKTKFLKVNVDTMHELSRSYKIRAMPTVLLLAPSGKEMERKVGGQQISEFLEQLKEPTL